MLTVPAFGEEKAFENKQNEYATVWVMENAESDLFDRYCALLSKEGYALKETYNHSARRFAAFLNAEGEGVFLNDYRGNRELSLVREKETAYFSYADASRACPAKPTQITQVHLEDFGMSYVIRLSDGRFIIFDGGCNFEPDRDRLFQCLKDGSPDDEKPVIAAWIMTHPHSDHYFCFFGFMEQYENEVVIEKFLFNFPEHDDLEHYPKLRTPELMEKGTAAFINIPKFLAWVEKIGAPVYTPRSGQRYQIGNASCEILSCMDDTMHSSQKINAISLMIRMELEGQVILWSTDASFSFARIPQRYGSYLKADILQIPHHGFQCGEADAEVIGYDLVNPKVCFLPVSDANAYTIFCTYKEGTRHIMRNVGVEEIITGTKQRTITLPYTAPTYAKRELEEKFMQGRENNGARVWIFSDLSTDCPEDFNFTILNTTIHPTPFFIDLYFEDRARAVLNIRAEVAGYCVKELSVIGDEVDGDWEWLDRSSLKVKGIPENSRFAVRFRSEKPLVVTHKKHAASYHSTLNG